MGMIVGMIIVIVFFSVTTMMLITTMIIVMVIVTLNNMIEGKVRVRRGTSRPYRHYSPHFVLFCHFTI